MAKLNKLKKTDQQVVDEFYELGKQIKNWFDDNPDRFEIGDRVQVIEQESIVGTIIKKDKNKNVVLDDDNSWCEENEDATLIYKDYELTKTK